MSLKCMVLHVFSNIFTEGNSFCGRSVCFPGEEACPQGLLLKERIYSDSSEFFLLRVDLLTPWQGRQEGKWQSYFP